MNFQKTLEALASHPQGGTAAALNAWQRTQTAPGIKPLPFTPLARAIRNAYKSAKPGRQVSAIIDRIIAYNPPERGARVIARALVASGIPAHQAGKVAAEWDKRSPQSPDPAGLVEIIANAPEGRICKALETARRIAPKSFDIPGLWDAFRPAEPGKRVEVVFGSDPLDAAKKANDDDAGAAMEIIGQTPTKAAEWVSFTQSEAKEIRAEFARLAAIAKGITSKRLDMDPNGLESLQLEAMDGGIENLHTLLEPVFSGDGG